jgi:hypothetical protein
VEINLAIDPLEVLDQMEDDYFDSDKFDMVSALTIAICVGHTWGKGFDDQIVTAILDEMALLADSMLKAEGLTPATRQRLERIRDDSPMFGGTARVGTEEVSK